MQREDEICISSDALARWMEFVLTTPGRLLQGRVLESFWASQLRSKAWLIHHMRDNMPSPTFGTVYVFGGWYGIGAALIKQAFPMLKVVSVDIDPDCAVHGVKLNPEIEFVTADMATFTDYTSFTRAVVNTSTEHVTQDVFDAWYRNIPTISQRYPVQVYLQGNNYDKIEEHVRCANDLAHFEELNPQPGGSMVGELDCGEFKRFMSIGCKR